MTIPSTPPLRPSWFSPEILPDSENTPMGPLRASVSALIKRLSLFRPWNLYGNTTEPIDQPTRIGCLHDIHAKTETDRKHAPYIRRTTRTAEIFTENRNPLEKGLVGARGRNAALAQKAHPAHKLFSPISSCLNEPTKDARPVACGGFSDVYCGRLDDGTQVAVKSLRIPERLQISDEEPTKAALKRCARELYVWSKCRHPNILPLLVVTSFQHRTALVSPWMQNGTLPEYIERVQVDRWQICSQIAEGLAYIHESGVIHGDLKAHNVLISDEGRPQISDFGLSKHLLGLTDHETANGGTVRWMAPELIVREEGNASASMPADVYAFGMTILEVVTGKQPYNEYQADVQVTLAAIKGVQPIRPPEMAAATEFGDQRWSVVTKCWEFQPDFRPLICNIKDMMELLEGTPQSVQSFMQTDR